MSTEYHYREHVSGAADSTLLLTFHGTGGDENQFFDFGRRLLPDATVVSPRGDVSEHGALRFFKRTGEGVYDMEDLAIRTAKMADFIRAKTEEHKPGRVVALGYSNGANIIASVMFAHTNIFDAAVLMHPLVPWTPSPQPDLSGRRILVTAGRHDPICPAPMTERLLDWLGEFGADVTPVWHDGGHDIRQEELGETGKFFKELSGAAG